jgi:hypothetical protein
VGSCWRCSRARSVEVGGAGGPGRFGQNGGVRLLADLDVDAPASSLFPWVEDLDRYPDWFGLVRSAVPEATTGERTTAPPGASTGASTGPSTGEPIGQPAWDVVLVGRLGPLRRLKRLRMARVEHRVDESSGRHRARFARAELDGVDHAAWELAADVAPLPGGARLTMALHYSGRFWAPPLQRLLDHEITLAKPRLAALAQGGGDAVRTGP